MAQASCWTDRVAAVLASSPSGRGKDPGWTVPSACGRSSVRDRAGADGRNKLELFEGKNCKELHTTTWKKNCPLLQGELCYLNVLHQTPGRADLLFADGACEDKRLRVGGVRLGVQLLPLAVPLALHRPPLLVLVRLAGPRHAGGANTFLMTEISVRLWAQADSALSHLQ